MREYSVTVHHPKGFRHFEVYAIGPNNAVLLAALQDFEEYPNDPADWSNYMVQEGVLPRRLNVNG